MSRTSQHGMRTGDVVRCGLFAAMTAVGAYIRVTLPVSPYPVTFSLQWLFVQLAGFLLGPRLGALSVAAYVVAGLCGVPVFVHGGGPQYIFRPGFGFLLGFVAAAPITGSLARRLPYRIPETPRLMIAAVAGLIVYYAVGMIYYCFMIACVLGAPTGWGIGAGIASCLATFPADLALCAAASVAASRLKPVLEKAENIR